MKHLEWEDWIQLYPKRSAAVLVAVGFAVGLIVGLIVWT
jgi:hypothetical protein